MPAPSPASPQTPPRCSIARRASTAFRRTSWVGFPSRAATPPIPQASCPTSSVYRRLPLRTRSKPVAFIGACARELGDPGEDVSTSKILTRATTEWHATFHLVCESRVRQDRRESRAAKIFNGAGACFPLGGRVERVCFQAGESAAPDHSQRE